MQTQIVLAFAMFIIVPLGLCIAARPSTGPTTALLIPLAKAAPFIAITAAISLALEQGVAAALLALPWFGYTLVLGAIGAGRVLSRRTLQTPGLGVDAALLFIVVGGAWFVISRAGWQPLGFSAAIVQLTAVHFHYAGFALPIVAGVVGDRLGRGVLLPAMVILGVPVTAVGITVDGTTEWFAATFMAIVGMVVAFRTMQLARAIDGAARVLLTISSLSLFVGMWLAIGWAWTQEFGWTYLDLQGMVRTHGMLNGFGFGLLGLIGINLLPALPVEDQAEVGMHLGRPSTERLARLQAKAIGDLPTNPIGLLKGERPETMEFKVWRTEIEHGDFDRAVHGIRDWAGHKRAGIVRYPEVPEIRAGETLAMAIPAGPLSVSATARIVEVIEEPDRFGFTYSTLPHHPEDGEESFIVTRHDDGTVEMAVSIMWRGAAVANHVLPPLTRFLQERAINHYLIGTADFDVSGVVRPVGA